MKKQNIYSGKFKLKVVLEALQENQAISAIAQGKRILNQPDKRVSKY